MRTDCLIITRKLAEHCWWELTEQCWWELSENCRWELDENCQVRIGWELSGENWMRIVRWELDENCRWELDENCQVRIGWELSGESWVRIAGAFLKISSIIAWELDENCRWELSIIFAWAVFGKFLLKRGYLCWNSLKSSKNRLMIRKSSLAKGMFSTKISLAKGNRSKTGAAHPHKIFFTVSMYYIPHLSTNEYIQQFSNPWWWCIYITADDIGQIHCMYYDDTVDQPMQVNQSAWSAKMTRSTQSCQWWLTTNHVPMQSPAVKN